MADRGPQRGGEANALDDRQAPASHRRPVGNPGRAYAAVAVDAEDGLASSRAETPPRTGRRGGAGSLQKKTSAEARAADAANPPLVLFFDEGRFGGKPDTGTVWALRGRVIEAPVDPSYENFYVYSAVAPLTGDSFSLFLPWVNTEMMNLYLEHLGAAFPGRPLWLILDGAGWHKAKDLRVPPHIRLIHLPPYSPELNPVERLWRWLRRHVTRNRLFASLDGLQAALADALNALSPASLQTLCACSYI